ncbi:MAG: hypothetical protein KAK02_07425 [Desulfobulbaceae bacterium]|nr:hypothetical protein [Desulfobulbaceae bacterium]
MRKTVLLLFGVFALCGCGNTSRNYDSSSPVTALLERELSAPIEEQAVQSGDGFLKGSIRSTAPPEVVSDANGEFYSFEIQMTTEEPAGCIVYKKRMPLANLAKTLIELEIKESGIIEDWAVKKFDVGVAGSHPYMYIQILYRAKGEDGYFVGHLKYFFAAFVNGAVVLGHDEPGYGRSFFAVARDFVASLEMKQDADDLPEPPKHHIYSASINGETVGFSEAMGYKKNGAHGVQFHFSSSLVPDGAGKFSASDSKSISMSDAHGFLTDSYSVSTNNATEAIEVELEQKGERAYVVKGRMQGKEIEGAFEASEPLYSDFKIEEAVKEKILTGKQTNISVLQYLPEIDPLNETRHDITRINKNILQSEMGGLTMKIEVDDEAVAQRMEIFLGVNKMVFERIWPQDE